MKNQKDLDFFNSIYYYDRISGVLINKHRNDMRKEWNTRHAGKPAGGIHKCSNYGYVRLFFIRDGKKIRAMAHNVIWLMEYGEYPKGEIDHIDGNAINNRIENLRDVNRNVNMQNKCRHSNNTSGVTGVGWYKTRGKWIATFRKDGKHHHLGYFDDFDDAAKAVRIAREDAGFHPGHGKEKPYEVDKNA